MDRFQLRADQQINNNVDTPLYRFTINGLEYDIEFPLVTPEVIDFAVLKWFTTDNPIYILEKEDRPKKVQTLFSTIERWAMMQHHQSVRDANGTLILPLTSIRRTDIQQIDDRTVAVDNDGVTNLTLYIREYINPVSNQKEYIVNNEHHDRKGIVEIIQIQAPKIVKVTYSVMFWATYIQDLNFMIQHMIQKFGKHHSVYFSEKLSFGAFLNNINDASNDEDISGTERIYKTNFELSVEAPLIDSNTIKSIRTYQGASVDMLVGESILDKYTSAKLYSQIDWRNPYKLER